MTVSIRDIKIIARRRAEELGIDPAEVVDVISTFKARRKHRPTRAERRNSVDKRRPVSESDVSPACIPAVVNQVKPAQGMKRLKQLLNRELVGRASDGLPDR